MEDAEKLQAQIRALTSQIEFWLGALHDQVIDGDAEMQDDVQKAKEGDPNRDT